MQNRKFRGNSEITSFEEFEKFTGVTTLANSEFAIPTLMSIIIPASITKINWGAFKGCSTLESIGNDLSNVTWMDGNVFEGCTSLKGIIRINADIINKSSCFKDCKSLDEVVLGDNVLTIGPSAFQGCGAKINIPAKVQSLKNSAFRECCNLTYVDIPETIKTMEWGVFYGSSNITYAIVRATNPPTIADEVFGNKYNYPIYVPATSVTSYKTATNWSPYADRIKALSEFIE